MENVTAVELESLRFPDAAPVSHRDIWNLVKRTLNADPSATGADAIYHALRTALFQALMGRRSSHEFREWSGALRDAAGLFRNTGHEGYAERLRTLEDLSIEAARADESISSDELMRKSFVRGVLRAIDRFGPRAKRAQVQQATQILQPQLSKLLGSLELAGLIAREKSGREVFLRLSPAGIAALEGGDDPPDSAPPVQPRLRRRGYSFLEVTPALGEA